MSRSSARLVVCLSLLLVASGAAAGASDRLFYVSAKWGSSDIDGSIDDTFQQIVDGDEDSTGFEVGFRFLKFLGVQAGYHDFGSVPGFGAPCGPGTEVCVATLVPTRVDTTAYSIAVVPRIPVLPILSIFGKVGYAYWESDVRAAFDEDGESFGDFDDSDVMYGAGVRLALFGPLSVYGEYEQIGDIVETISFGATLSF